VQHSTYRKHGSRHRCINHIIVPTVRRLRSAQPRGSRHVGSTAERLNFLRWTCKHESTALA